MTTQQPLDLGKCTLTHEQAAYVAEKVADIAKHCDGYVIVKVIPPYTEGAGELDFAFVVEEVPVLAGDDMQKVTVRIVE